MTGVAAEGGKLVHSQARVGAGRRLGLWSQSDWADSSMGKRHSRRRHWSTSFEEAAWRDFLLCATMMDEVCRALGAREAAATSSPGREERPTRLTCLPSRLARQRNRYGEGRRHGPITARPAPALGGRILESSRCLACSFSIKVPCFLHNRA